MPLDVLAETSKEIATQITPLAMSALRAYLIHKGINETTLEGIRTCTDIRNIFDQKVRTTVLDSVLHTTQVAAGTLSVLAIDVKHQRCLQLIIYLVLFSY